ncbi:MAG: hypothetical protein V1744_08200 [Candidatus Altiarchaeota archaeon]
MDAEFIQPASDLRIEICAYPMAPEKTARLLIVMAMVAGLLAALKLM